MSPSGAVPSASTSEKRERPADADTQSAPVAKKPAVDSENTVDIRLETFFGVPADVLFDVLVDGGKQAQAIGGKCWEGKLSVGSHWSAADNYCSGTVLHLIPNKLIVETWRETSWEPTTPSSTVIMQLLPRYQSNDKETRLILTHYGAPAGDTAAHVENGWVEYVFEPIRRYLGDEKNKRPKRVGRNLAHIEIPAVDPERAGEFYKSVFGWDVSKWAEDYVGFTTGPKDHDWGFVDGGFIKSAATKPIADHSKHTSMTPYYDAYPVEEYEAKVKQAGGKVLKPKTVTYFGVIAECEDTEGNPFVLYQRTAE